MMDGILTVDPARDAAPPAAGTAEWPQTVAQFETLVESVQDELVHFACCRLRSLADAEDAVQEVLVRAYLDRARHCAVTQVRPYLYRMVANRCTDMLRVRQREARRTSPDDPALASSPAPQPDRLEEIERSLSRLPHRQAEAVRLRVFADLPFQAIADAQGVPLATIKSRFRYGIERLRSILSREVSR
jgi:RNA polymerase sigma-70 factor, ECF subfamily